MRREACNRIPSASAALLPRRHPTPPLQAMKLQQLRYLCQIVDSGFNVTEAAKTLHTAQSGISRQVRLLEEELGSEILLREGNRITGLTEPGAEIVAACRRLLTDAKSLKH